MTESKISAPHAKIEFLCSNNPVCCDGNHQAHKATPDEVKNAIKMHDHDSGNKQELIELYQFIYLTW